MSGQSGKKDGAFVEEVLHGAKPGPIALTLRLLLTPIAWTHQAWLEVYLLIFRLGLRRRYRVINADGAPIPVVSIGNLSSGGTGKTPMTQLVARRLGQVGHSIVILSRGHGASGASDDPRVVSNGKKILLEPAEAGDEPSLLARSLPTVPVIIGRDRRRSARLAVECCAPDIIVLDDALQYWQLHRDLDIVLLDARRPFDNGYVIPRGLLREPPSHLARAGIVVITRADAVSAEALAATRTRVATLAPKAAVFTATHAPLGWVRPAGTDVKPLGAFKGRRAIVFSAIADNAAFRKTVEALGVEVVAAEFFGDHHAYAPADIFRIAKSATDAGADIFLTTEKDLVKVGPLWPPVEGLFALRIGMSIGDEDGFVKAITQIVDRIVRSPPGPLRRGSHPPAPSLASERGGD